MFEYLHTKNDRDIYLLKYNHENYEIFYHPESKRIEQILPLYANGTSTVARLFEHFIENQD